MNISPKTLLKIDRWFRVPYRLLTAFLASRKLTAESTGPVLVIKFMGLGSIIKFAALCDELGVEKSNVILLTFDQHHELGPLFGFEKTLLIRTTGLFSFFTDCWNIFARVKRLGLSGLVDFERCSHAVGFFSTLLASRAGCKKISFEKRAGDFSSRTTDTFAIHFLTPEDMLLKGIEYLSKSTHIRRQHPVDINPKKVLVNINASEYLLARRYSKDSFTEFVRLLNDHGPGLVFHFTGSQKESLYVGSLVSELSNLNVNAVNASGRWDLSRLALELMDCVIFITGDSGPLHLAAYLKVPMVALWGPTQAAPFGYHQREYIHNVSLNLNCSPCFTDPTSVPAVACQGRIDCMKIPAALLAARVLEIISRSGSRREVILPPGLIMCNTHPVTA